MTNWYSKRIKGILSAIAHPSRVAILEFLIERDFGTNKALRQYLRKLQSNGGGDSPAVITHHVKLLRKADLVAHSTEDQRILIITAVGRRFFRMLRQVVSESEVGEPWDRSL